MDTASLPLGDFPGRDRLTSGIDAAIDAAAGDAARTVAAIGGLLNALQAADGLRLPAAVAEPHPDHYARRELYRSAAHGYCIVAMTWAPGQDTPLHDHDGLWGVVAVWRGRLTITDYALLRSDGERAWFRPLPEATGVPGAIGRVVPPAEHHLIANRSTTELAVSVHVYQRAAEACTIFVPQADGSYACERLRLTAEP
ncbi:MAG TPA: cysteine dioxygenase family protein [Dokdonella sp.]|uniref:cysteine dioxygenase family protein n=1 Tax=Dokdonella sp. TaxID=2291710 RepID=UPI002BA1A557|nr:cysteine dioxygenase family protein [Dokdonella sp.]HUD41101.1 cysteine dioxygenase family protein [Dokdonella sp.]